MANECVAENVLQLPGGKREVSRSWESFERARVLCERCFSTLLPGVAFRNFLVCGPVPGDSDLVLRGGILKSSQVTFKLSTSLHSVLNT